MMNDPLAWTPEELEAGIIEVIQKATGRAVEDRDANLFAMGFDSLGMLDVLALLEKRFSISLSEDVVEGFHSVSAIARIVQGARS